MEYGREVLPLRINIHPLLEPPDTVYILLGPFKTDGLNVPKYRFDKRKLIV